MEDEIKTRTMGDAAHLVATGDHAEQGPRFLASGLTIDGYQTSRIRRYQRNQSNTVVAGLLKFGIKTTDEILDKITESVLARRAATMYLQSCLVGPQARVGPAYLLKTGDRGLARMMRDLPAEQIADALTIACNQVGILQQQTAAEAADAEDAIDWSP